MSVDLSWLLAAPQDFRSQCAAPDASALSLIKLANHALNSSQLMLLSSAWDRLEVATKQVVGLTPFRLGILSNATTDFLPSVIRATGLRYALNLEVVTGDFDQVLAQAADPLSAINRARCDAVLLALDYRALGPVQAFGIDSSAELVALLSSARDAIRECSGAPVIFSTIAPSVEPIFGSFDALVQGTPREQVDAVNTALREMARHSSGDLLFDLAMLASNVGLARWHDVVQWNVAKAPFAQDILPLYAEHIVRLLAALRGKSRKCLVLDLDNTLWGGVIGDDALAGIVLGNGSPVGEAFLDVQRTVLRLRERGIILAICSKNDERVARSVFRKHPEMLLREEHIAAFVANWTDKATNLEAIARELSIGLDSLVFMDDNPAERAQVRQVLPQVAVPELPDDPSLFGRTLLAGGYFEAVAFSQEDRDRAAQYQANSERAAARVGARDLTSYLKSLDMVASFKPFDETGRARITQLINKSNQFNLTTRRYTEADIQTLEGNPDVMTMQIRLADRFGDNGIVSIIIGRREGQVMDIDTWLMSCRVLGRELEREVLNQMVLEARRRGLRSLSGCFRPSGRNEMVRNHYSGLGFSHLRDDLDGSSRWMLDVNVCVVQPTQVRAQFEFA
jgi:FkbH-like protein